MLYAYWQHTRPKSFLPSFVLAFTGYVMSSERASDVRSLLFDCGYLFVLFSIGLFGGTGALNSHFDKDKGPLNYLDHPPPKPPYLGWYGFSLLLLGAALAWFRGAACFAFSSFAVLLSVFYSVPFPGCRWRGKEIAGIDSLINSLGCGATSVLVGYSFTGAPIDGRVFWVAAAFTFGVVGSYPATQVFQLKPGDTYERARNFSSRLGPANALRFGAVCLFLAAVLLAGYALVFLRGALALVLFGAFLFLYLKASRTMWHWAGSPYEDAQNRFKNVIFHLIVARVFFILAHWSL